MRYTKHKIRTRTWISIWLLCLFVPLIAILLLKPTGTEAAWMDDAWKYRQPIQITAHTGAETNVYLNVTGYDASDATRYQTDCGDIRFTKETGELLPYYVTTCSASSTFHVFMDSFPAGAQTIYIYYGNPNAPDGFSATDFATAATGIVYSTGSETQSQGPIAYWAFDEGVDNTCSGGTNDVCNSSGDTALDGTNTSATWQTEDMCTTGKCLKFNGSTSYANLGNATSLQFATTAFTLSAWVKPNNYTNWNEILAKSDAGGTNRGYLLRLDQTTGYATFHVYTGAGCTVSSVSDTVALGTNRWHLVTGVYDRTNTRIYIYVDGVLKNTTYSVSGDVCGTNGTLSAGRLGANNGEYFTGFLDEIKIYNYLRTTNQIKADFAAKTGSTKGVSAAMGTGNQKSLSDGLVGYWKMDESAANSCSGGVNDSCDSSGNGNNGAWNGNATNAVGKFGNGVTLDGTGDYVDGGSPTNLGLSGNASYTLSAWVNPTATRLDGAIVSYGGATNNHVISITADDSGNIETVHYGNDFSFNTAWVTGSWQHVVITYDGTTEKLYVNGEYKDSKNPSSLSITSGEALKIGSASWNSTVAAETKIDEVRIYNRSLSSSEVRQLYNWAPGPVGYWNFNEKTNTTANDLGTKAQNGTLSGSPLPIWSPGKYGSSVLFNGATSNGNSIQTTSYTISNIITYETWFYANSAGASSLGRFIDGDSDNFAVLFNSSATNLQFIYPFNTAVGKWHITPSSLLNSWHHLTITYDSSSTSNTPTWYIDGVPQAITVDQTPSGTANPSSATLVIGNRATLDRTFNGRIDEVKIYNYLRTPAQIMEDMNGGHPIGGSPVGSQLIYWPLDEGQSTTTNNLGTASSSNGTLTSIASPATATSGWTASGKVNKGIVFDGSDDKVVLATASDAAVDFNGSESFSASAWIYPTTVPTSATEEDLILGKWDQASAQRGYRIFLENDDTDSTGRISVEIYDESTDQTISVTGANDSISENTWYHVAFTFNGGAAGAANDLKLFVNGRQIGGNSANASFLGLEDVTSDFTVGDYDATDNTAALTAFTGRIDEVKVYPGVLSIDNIQVDMNTGAAAAIQPTQNSTNEASLLSDDTGNPPLIYWNFDENTGTSTVNNTGVGSATVNNGTMNGFVAKDWVPGKVGQALNFDGSDNRISLADTADLTKNTLTAEIWAKFKATPSAGNTYVVWEHDHSADPWESFSAYFDESNIFYCKVCNTSNTCVNGNTGAISINTWYHFACVWDGSNVTTYLNGVLKDTDALTGSLKAADGTFQVGAGDGWTSSPVNGTLDDFKFYDYARTPAQIAYDYNRGGPIGWWQMDECEGTTIHDESGSGNNGTLTVTATGGNTNGVGTCGTATSAWGTGATGKYNSSINFDGNGDYVQISQNARINDITQLSVSAWFKATSYGQSSLGRIIDKGTASSSSSGWGLFVTNNGTCNNASISFYRNFNTDSNNGWWCTPTNSISTGSWYHVVVVYDKSSSSNAPVFYINGSLVATTTSSAPSGTADSDAAKSLYIGTRSGIDRTFDGLIDDARIYNYALSANQIKILHNDGAVKFGPATGQP